MFISKIIKEFDNEFIGEYWNNIPAIKELKELKLNKRVTFFVGENGSGKSTLLETIADSYGLNPEGGSVNFNFSSKETHSSLTECLTLAKKFKAQDSFFLRAESFYNVASEIEKLSGGGEDDFFIKQYGEKSLHKQSHGESFLSLILNRFRGNGLYILDEPEAALSPFRQMTMLTAINDLANNNSQFIIATHSPILTAVPNSEIFEFSEKGIRKIDYEEQNNYLIMKDFINNYKTWTKRLTN